MIGHQSFGLEPDPGLHVASLRVDAVELLRDGVVVGVVSLAGPTSRLPDARLKELAPALRIVPGDTTVQAPKVPLPTVHGTYDVPKSNETISGKTNVKGAVKVDIVEPKAVVLGKLVLNSNKVIRVEADSRQYSGVHLPGPKPEGGASLRRRGDGWAELDGKRLCETPCRDVHVAARGNWNADDARRRASCRGVRRLREHRIAPRA